MFKVFFNDLKFSVKIGEFTKDIEAVQLALALHQISNVSHSVYIEKDDNVILSLENIK